MRTGWGPSGAALKRAPLLRRGRIKRLRLPRSAGGTRERSREGKGFFDRALTGGSGEGQRESDGVELGQEWLREDFGEGCFE